MAFIQANFMSSALMRTVNINVILPVDKIQFFPSQDTVESKSFKTLYLLHGIFGSQVDWINGTLLQRFAEAANLAVVMPAGENSFYIDHEVTHQCHGKFIGEELVEVTRKMFPLSHRREDTFIAGLSMGGYGALRNGLKYSETFGYIGALSAATIIKGIEKRTNDSPVFFERRDYAEAVFGNLETLADSDRNITWLADRLIEQNKEVPGIYMCCGVDDFLIVSNRELRDDLQSKGIQVTYVEGPGAHEWDFWNTYIKHFIDWLPLEQGGSGVTSGSVRG